MSLFHTPATVEHNLWNLHWVAGLFIAPAFLLTMKTFPFAEIVPDKLFRAAVWGGAAVIALISVIWPENFIRTYVVSGNIPQIQGGPLVSLFELYFVVYFSVGFFYIFRTFRRTYGRPRAHILGGGIGLVLGTCGALLTNVVSPIHFGKEFIWLGPVFGAIGVISFSYMLFGATGKRTRLLPITVLAVLILGALLVQTIIAPTTEDFILDGAILAGNMLLFVFLIRDTLLEAEDRKRVQNLLNKLRKTNEELRQADRVKSEFLDIVSHHLRAPLTHIKWSISELLNESYGAFQNAEQRKLMQNLLSNNERLVGFVTSLMDTSRIEAGEILLDARKTDIEMLVREVVSRLQHEATHYYHVKMVMIPSNTTLPELFVDKDSLLKAIENIVENALVYSHAGGTVYIKLELREKFVEIEITDSGIGIPAEDIQHIGKKFFRSAHAKKYAAEGTGLGVFIAHHIMHLHGGDLEIQSEKDKGTTVFLRLPLELEKNKPISIETGENLDNP